MCSAEPRKSPAAFFPPFFLFFVDGAAHAGCQGGNGVSKKREWIVDPADILTGFTGNDSQQYGTHLLEFPEREVSCLQILL